MKNSNKDFIEVIQYLLVCKPKNLDAMQVKIFCPGFIVGNLVRGGMNAAIDFDFKLVLDTKRVKNEMTVWVLAAEFQSRKSTSPQCLPQPLLCLGRIMPGMSRRLNNCV